MVDVSNKHNSITVEVSNKHKSFTVEVENKSGNTNVTASSDSAQYWANQSHTYANQSRESAQEAKEYAELANSYIENFEGVVVNAETELISIKDAGVQEITTAKDEAVNSVTTAKSEAIDNITSTKTTILQDIEFVADGEKEEIRDLANDIKENASDIINRVSLSMFDTILKDHVLTYEESKGLALQGTYVYKNAIAGERYGYPDFYNKVVEEYNEATTTETVNGATVKVHANGHKFYDIANKTAIDDFFNTMGSAWFYGVDTANERIFLPRNKYFATTGAVVGNGMTIGLTNGSVNEGMAYLYRNSIGLTVRTVQLGQEVGYVSSTGGTDFLASETQTQGVGLTTDPTKSGIILNPDENKLLYICVGNTVSDTSWVDVVTQVEGGVKDLEDKKNASIAEIDANAKSYNNLTNRQITNCLLEVPQRIKLELADGVLTLKAGSVVIVPNGFEEDGVTPKFDYVTIDRDVYRENWGGWSRVDLIWMRCDDVLTYTSLPPAYCCSGSTAPTSFISKCAFWYDTTNNICKLTTDSGATWFEARYSLPFGIVTFTDIAGTGIKTINQVFNGMGYIGSTIWVDKGVKGLIPNGRNEDGSLKNIEYTHNRVELATRNVTGNKPVIIGNSRYLTIGNQPYTESATPLPAKGSGYSVYLNTSENIFYVNNGSAWIASECFLVATASLTSGVINNLNAKQPFRAVDYNNALVKTDKQEIISWNAPDFSSLITVSKLPFTAPFDCYVFIVAERNGNTSTTGYITINGFKILAFRNAANNTVGSETTQLMISKGDVVNVSDNASFTSGYYCKPKGAN